MENELVRGKRWEELRRWEYNRDLLDEILGRHPDKASACGAMLAEICSAEDRDQRQRALTMFGCLRCRRGLGRLEKLIAPLVARTPHVDEYCVSDDMKELYKLLFAIGSMDTKASHAVLVHLIRHSDRPCVRAAAIEATAFESKWFDWDLVLPFLSPKSHQEEIHNALYAVWLQGYARHRPADARKRLRPLLKHPYHWVRYTAVYALADDPSNMRLILGMKNDPVDCVRDAVAEAVRNNAPESAPEEEF
jgi:hypothetical protein